MGLRRKSALKLTAPCDKNNDTSTVSNKRRATSRAKPEGIHIVSSNPPATPEPRWSEFFSGSESSRKTDDVENQKSTVGKVEAAKQNLGRLECDVISALYPVTGKPQSFEEIASRLGMTLNEVREIADNALRGLRGTSRARLRTSTVWN